MCTRSLYLQVHHFINRSGTEFEVGEKKHVPGFSKAKLFGKKLKPFLSAVASSMKVMGEPGWEGPAGGLRSPGLGKSLSEEEEVFG